MTLLAAVAPDLVLEAPPSGWLVLLRTLGPVVAAAILATGLAWAVRTWRRRDADALGPETRLLARAHGLGLGDRRRLRRLARASGVEDPGSLLLSRGLYRRSMLVAARDGLDGRDLARLATLHRRVHQARETGAAIAG